MSQEQIWISSHPPKKNKKQTPTCETDIQKFVPHTQNLSNFLMLWVVSIFCNKLCLIT